MCVRACLKFPQDITELLNTFELRISPSPVAITKVKEHKQPYYSPRAKGRIVGCI